MNKPICVLQCPIFTRSGYGDWSLAVAKSILRYDKYNLIISPTPWGNTPRKITINEIDQTDTEAIELFNRILKSPLTQQPDLFIQITIPNEFQAIGKYNIGITAGIETTIPLGEWIEGLNKMNFNIVTSKFTKQVFEEAKFVKNYPDGRQEALNSTKPMEVCFWGADTNIYKKTDQKIESVEEVMTQIPEKFAFLFVGAWTNLQNPFADRKDIGNLIKTFCTAFKDKKGDLPCLILKTNGVNFSKPDKELCLSRIKHIQSLVGGKVPNVYLLHGELSDVEMNALFNHDKIKAHLSFTHGEGFGHPLLLSTLSGKPVIASKWSGHLDFLNPQYATYFEGNVQQIDPAAVNQWLVKEGSWFNVAYSLAEDKLRTLYYSNNTALADNAEKLRLENSEKFSMAEMDKVLHSYLDKYVPEFSVEKKIILPKLPKKIEFPKVVS